MFKYQKYIIREGDSFHPSSFNSIESDIENVYLSLSTQAADFKAEMLIAWLNKENFNTASVAVNPQLARKLSSGDLQLENIQALFDCSREHPTFKKELESYIRNRFEVSTINS